MILAICVPFRDEFPILHVLQRVGISLSLVPGRKEQTIHFLTHIPLDFVPMMHHNRSLYLRRVESSEAELLQDMVMVDKNPPGGLCGHGISVFCTEHEIGQKHELVLQKVSPEFVNGKV